MPTTFVRTKPRVVEERDGFPYHVVGIAPSLAEAREWVNELKVEDDPAA